MAESAPLTIAHDHARKAAEELDQLHWKAAAEEHHKASKSFARAARATGDSEALRVLKLLEDQHKKLAQIILSEDSAPPDNLNEELKEVEIPPVDVPDTTPQQKGKSNESKSRTSATALASSRVSSQTRESSPSLARDIAQRRGILPSGRTPLSPAEQARARQVSPDSRRRVTTPAAAKPPSSVVEDQARLQEERRARKAQDDDGFAKFYSNLTTGTMSKLSAVLAYAGMPLSVEDPPQEQMPQKPLRRTVSAGNDPDVKKIFSKAALNAIEEKHRQRGTLGHGFGPAESFYIVQKGGGTYSYADIARNQQQLGGISEEDDEPEFVDAKEVPAPASPTRVRLTNPKRTSFGSLRTNEELDLENATLKQTLKEVADRLSAFEAHAQDASMAALTQSMVNFRPQKPVADPALEERIRQLEKQVEQQAEEKQKMETRAATQEKTLKKYNAKWEQLKKGAREKEKARGRKEPLEKGADDDEVVEEPRAAT